IVAEMIERNRRTFGNAQREFHCLDITADKLPRADLVLCRDCLVHLSFKDVFRALENIRRSGARFLLTTTFSKREQNRDIETGNWRPLNLERAPFSMPPPQLIVDDSPQ